MRGVALGSVLLLLLGACSSDSDETQPLPGGQDSGTPETGAGGSGGTTGSGGSAGTGGVSATGGQAGQGGSGTGGAAGVGRCGISTEDDTCDACMFAECASECATATADPSFADIFLCYADCADNRCVQECNGQHPSVVPLLEAVNKCLADRCPTECANLTP